MPAKSPSPLRSYLFADRHALAFLQWSQASGYYELNGSVLAMRVQVQANHYTFHIGRGSVLVGTISAHGLLLTSLVDERNSVVVHTWYLGTKREYTTLLSSFTAYQAVQQTQHVLLSLETSPLPDNSSPTYFHEAVLQAQQRVQNEQVALDTVKTAGNATCSSSMNFLARFPLPSRDAVLQFPFSQQQSFASQAQVAQSVINQSAIAQATQMLVALYQRAEALPSPHVAGLPLPWIINPQREMLWGGQQVQALAQEVQVDVTMYAVLLQNAQQIRQQVENIQRIAFCE